MRIIADIVDSVTGSIRFVALLFFLTVLGFGLFLTVGASVVAPQAAEAVANSAERVGNRAIAAAQEESRNQALAKEGWGFDDSGPADVGSGGEYSEEGEAIGGWGD